jgi:hypothetical protein
MNSSGRLAEGTSNFVAPTCQRVLVNLAIESETKPLGGFPVNFQDHTDVTSPLIRFAFAAALPPTLTTS